MQTVMELVKLHEQYKLAALVKPHLILEDIVPIIEDLLQNPAVRLEATYTSFENRPIHHLSIGKGPINVLAWTQMHGDEPTATASVLDLLHIFIEQPAVLPKSFWEKFTFHIVPMLNPDGAEYDQRVNAQGLDINRDSLRLQTPEARILKDLAMRLNPFLCLNLHDQNDYHGAGLGGEPATLSFLAPSSEPTKLITEQRKRAMQLIVSMFEMIDLELPKQIGRYDDTFSLRSFGDQLMVEGFSTILVEAGKQFNDPMRQCARRMTAVSIITALRALADNSYQNLSAEQYFAIPENHEDTWVDIKLSHIQVSNAPQNYHIDITINIKNGIATLVDIGDCQNVNAFKTYHCREWQLPFSIAKNLRKDDGATFELIKNDESLFIKNGVLLNPPANFRLE